MFSSHHYVGEESKHVTYPYILDRISASSLVPINQTYVPSSNISVKYCAGIAPWTWWTLHNFVEITMYINTSNCNFSQIPTYYTSVSGIGLHDRGTGIHAIYLPSKAGFRLYRRWSRNGVFTSMLNFSQTYQWNVNWVGLYY